MWKERFPKGGGSGWVNEREEGTREEGMTKSREDPGKEGEPWEREECDKEVGHGKRGEAWEETVVWASSVEGKFFVFWQFLMCLVAQIHRTELEGIE